MIKNALVRGATALLRGLVAGCPLRSGPIEGCCGRTGLGCNGTEWSLILQDRWGHLLIRSKMGVVPVIHSKVGMAAWQPDPQRALEIVNKIQYS